MSLNRFQREGILAYTFDPSGNTAQRTADTAFTLAGEPIPDNAIIVDAFYEVITTFASGTNACTLAISTGQGAGDLVAATAISDARNIWNASTTVIRGTKITAPNLGADAAHDSQVETVDLFAGTKIKMTANRQPTVTTAASEALTAGKLNLYIKYVLAE